jgi:hypothetical protein
MDAMVTTVSGARQEWTLADRFRRKVGQFAECQFLVSAEDTSASGPLAKVYEGYTSLAAALDAIAEHLRGVCRFAKEDV